MYNVITRQQQKQDNVVLSASFQKSLSKSTTQQLDETNFSSRGLKQRYV